MLCRPQLNCGRHKVGSAQPHPSRENVWIVKLSGTVSDPVLANSGNAPGRGVVTDNVRITLVDAAAPAGELDAHRPRG